MLFRKAQWDGLADGSITVAFRRQKRPTTRAGGTLRTPAGMLAIESVVEVSDDELTDPDARRAGHSSLDELRAALGPPDPDRRLYRVEFHHAGDDPRIALRNDVELAAEDLDAVVVELDRLDRAAPQPWTRRYLRLIADRPATVSTELAAEIGVELAPFKQNVRKLKALGLTESLDVGYRLSPRCERVLVAVSGRRGGSRR